MANEDKKDFNAMLHDKKDMPKIQIITDQKSIEKYGGSKMYFAPPIDYDKVMKKIPYGKVITVGKIREYFAELNGADFTEPITAGVFVSIVAWASYQRSEDETPYWRTLKANGELNAKYPNGIEAQKEKLEAEGHTIIQKGRKNIRYYVKDYENSLFVLKLVTSSLCVGASRTPPRRIATHKMGAALQKGCTLFVMPIFLSTGASNGRKISRRVLRSRRGYARCCRAGCRNPQRSGRLLKLHFSGYKCFYTAHTCPRACFGL